MGKLYWTIGLFFTVHLVLAQPLIRWQKTFGGKGSEIARQIIHTADGGYLIAGTANLSDGDVTGVHRSSVQFINPDGTVFFDDDVWLIKVDSQQQIVWQKCIGGNSGDTPTQVLEVVGGDIILLTTTGSNDIGTTRAYGNGDALITRLNASGDVLWQQIFGGNGIDRAYACVETGNGDLIVAGYTESTTGDVQANQGKGDGWVFRINASGALLWKKCLGTASYDRLHAIAKNGSDYLLFGQTADSEYSKVSSRAWVVRITEDGAVRWQRFPCDLALPVTVTTYGPDYIMAGYTFRATLTTSRYDKDLWVARIDSAANLRWERTFGGTGEDAASSVVLLSDNTIVIGGSTSSNEAEVLGKHGPVADSWLLNLDEAGSLRWQYCLGGSGNEGEQDPDGFIFDKLYALAGLAVDADGGLLLATYSQSKDGDVSVNRPYQNRPTKDFWVVKFEPEQQNPFQIGLIQPVSFCNRQLELSFQTARPFAAGTTYAVELSNRKGSFERPVPLPVVGTGSPLTVTLPDTLVGGFGYRVRVIAGSSNLVSAPSTRFNPNTTAVVTVTGDSTVKSGDGAILHLNFSGGPPYSYTFSNGLTRVTNTESFTVNVPTLTPTVYTIKSLSNLCGTGAAKGQATIDVAYCSAFVYTSCQNSGRIDDFRLTSDTDIPLLINNNSGCSPNNYGDFTRLATAPVARLGRYRFTARLRGTGTTGNYLSIWIDYNQDRILTANELVSQRGLSQASTTINDSFVIPATAAVGPTRMRVYLTAGATEIQACYSAQYGEYEDYTLFIQDVGEADLSLQVATDKQVIAINELITINGKLTNSGALEATNVSISNKLPPNLQFVASPDLVPSAGNALTGVVASIQPGETKSFSFVAKAAMAGTYWNATQITRSDRRDPDSRPNSGTGDGEDDAASVFFRTKDPITIMFVSPNPDQIPLPTVLSNQPKADSTKADLSVSLSLSTLTPRINELTSLSVIVDNQGGLATGGITLRLTLPPNAYVVSNGQTIADLYVIQLPGSLAAGGTIAFPVSIKAVLSGTYAFSVEVATADVSDPDSVMNNGTATGEDDTAWLSCRVR